MNCARPQCGAENETGSRFCHQCGGPMCPSCGQAVVQNWSYCSWCGCSLSAAATDAPAAAARESTGELRDVAALYCDLVESTPLLSDPDYDSVIQDYHVTCTRIVEEEFGGRVQDRFGDAFLAYFGFPTALEHKEQRAVRAALRLLTAIGTLRTSAGPLRGRIGISTGSVVAKQVGAQQLPVGEAPALAARLLSDALPGAILITESTLRLVESYFDVRNVGARLPKGFTRLTEVYEVLRERTTGNRLEMLKSGRLTPLIGRDAHVRSLAETWKAVKQERQRQVVLICGEPGIGKSRLVIALQEHVEADPDSWLITCVASPFYQNTAFYPVVDLLQRHVLGFEASDTDQIRLEKLDRWLEQFDRQGGHEGFSAARVRPLFARLLSIDTGESVASDNPLSDKQKTMAAMLQVLRLRAKQKAVLFICEDVHWADASTRELLEQLIEMEPGRPILVVLTFRPEFDSSAWVDREGVAQMTLSRLDAVHAAEVVRHSSPADLSTRMLEQVVDRAGGVPLFLEELSRSASDAGIPSSLKDSLMTRLDRLDKKGSGTKAVAQLASILGREFSHELLQAITGLPDPMLDAALEQLVQDQVLYLEALEPERRYLFKHALIQEAAYEAIVPRDRERVHRRVAETLIEQFPDTAAREPELVAHHYSEGARGVQALPYWMHAGRNALVRFANSEAIAHLERARSLLNMVESETERQQLELPVQQMLAPAYMAIKGWASDHVEQTCRRVLELTDDFGALWGLWTNSFLRSRMQEALQLGSRLRHLADEMVRAAAGAPASRMTNYAIMAHHAHGYSHYYRGEFAEACQVAASGLALQCDPDGRFALESEREIVRAFQFSSSAALRMMLGSSLWMLGQPVRARTLVADSIALTRELDHFPSEAYALASSLLLHHFDLDVDATAAAALRLRILAQQERFEIWTPFADMFDGWVIVERGGGADGIAKTKRGLDEWQRTGSILNQTIVTAMLARSMRSLGRVDEALAALDAEIADSARRQELLFAPELFRLKGEMLIERNQVSEGVAALNGAVSLAGEQGAVMLELRALLSLLRVPDATGATATVVRLGGTLQALNREECINEVQGAMATLAELGMDLPAAHTRR